MPVHFPTITVLENSYALVKDLRTYLLDILVDVNAADQSTSPSFEPSNADSPGYHSLLQDTYVATSRKLDAKLSFEEAHVGMDGVVKRAQIVLFQQSKPNVLKAGYRLLPESKIVNSCINTVVTALLSREWELLLKRIGISTMLHLLTETSIFIVLPNGCLCQMTGEPFNPPTGDIYATIAKNTKKYLKRSASSSDTEPAPKRRKLDRQFCGRPKQASFGIKTPSLISIIRARMFYSRTQCIPKTDKIVVGLPLRHVFNINNRDGSEYVRSKDSSFFYDQKDHTLQTRHTLKYIFPRQHNLNNPFRVTSSAEVFEYPDYTDREDEIKRAMTLLKNKSTPKRLKDIVPVVDKMLWRHAKCPYKLLYDKFCPSKVTKSTNSDLDDATILEWMSERSIQIQTQASLSENTTTTSFGNITMTPTPPGSYPKPRFADFACSYIEVFQYVAVVAKAVVPKTFWGSRKNFRAIMRHVKAFISGRRFETLSLHGVLQGFSISDCEWLAPPGPGSRQQHRVSVSDALKRKELLEEFSFWFFDSFVLPLIKTCFYVTESSAFRNQVLYFRQDDWATLCAPLVERLKSATFERLSETDAMEILRQRELGFSFVRLLPKETGVRPIVNLRRKPGNGGLSINQVLRTTFDLLTYEKKTRPHLTGASVWGSDEVHAQLLQLKSRLKRDSSGRLPKLFFVKVDVQACFDTIDQGKLLSILRDLISEDQERYTIRRRTQVRFSWDRIYKEQKREAFPKDEDPQFLDMAMKLANALRHVIFINHAESWQVTKNDALQMLNSHIMDNIVKIGSNYYRQVVGIPQGSILSSLLCSFFYGDLERNFERYTSDKDSILLRVIDDYLFVTTDLDKAKSFLDMMNKGHKEYGCFIAKEKTMTNFDYDHHVMNVIDQRARHFNWCGYAIDMRDLSVSVDYTRYSGFNLSCTLTTENGRKPGASFARKMLQLAKSRSHAIYTDPVLNRKEVIHLNIYQNFLLSAMKMHSYLREQRNPWQRQTIFIRGTIQNMIEFSFTSLRSRTRKKQSNQRQRGTVKRESAAWLGYQAFYEVFSRKPTQYRALIKWLKGELKSGYLGMENITY